MLKVYLETSVVSYYVSEISRDLIVAGHQLSTKEFWMLFHTHFHPVVSALVIKEALQGNEQKAKGRMDAINGFEVVDYSDDAEQLVELLIAHKCIPKEYPEDALHIALATTSDIDFIATWNFKHINNPFTKNKIQKTIEEAGYVCPVLASPEELLGELL